MINKRIAQSIAALRQALVSADCENDGSFAAVFSSFLDITERQNLIEESKPAKDPILKATIENSVRKLFGEDAAVMQIRMLRYAAAGFLHGSFFVGSSMGTFFYFEQDKRGMLAVY